MHTLFPTEVRGLIIGVLVLALSSCSNPFRSLTSTSSERSLMATADAVHASLQRLESYELVEKPQLMNWDILAQQDVRLTERVALDWSGPAEPLLERLAQELTYTLRTLGPPPAIPLMVQVSGKNTVGTWLKDVSLQVGKRADLLLYPDAQIIELRYLSL